mgnify:FL=1
MLISKGKLELMEETLKEDGRTPLNCYKFIYDEMPRCPDCGAPMHERDRLSGKDRRNFTGMDGTLSKVEIRRVVCDDKACYNHNHPKRNLPDILVPYGRYDAEVHQAVADGSNEVPCSPSTIKRMLKKIADQFMMLLWALTQMGIHLSICKEECKAMDLWPILRNAVAGFDRWYLRALKMAVNRFGALYCECNDTG